jgi:DNA-binding XRE family transcriptional regulator
LRERATLIRDSSGHWTHAVIPYSDYVRLLATEDAITGVRTLDDPKTEWIDVEKWIGDLAAPKIIAARKRRGWTQAQFGAKLGMPQSQVSRIEKNPEALTYRTLNRIAKVLGVSAASLL